MAEKGTCWMFVYGNSKRQTLMFILHSADFISCLIMLWIQSVDTKFLVFPNVFSSDRNRK